MYGTHPDTMFQCQEFHRQELLAEAEKSRLIAQLRRTNRERSPRRSLRAFRPLRIFVQGLGWRSAPTGLPSPTAHLETWR